MTHELNCRISTSAWHSLQSEAERSGTHVDHIVEQALAAHLGVEHHTLFQVSTIGALVKGVFQGCVRAGDLKRHGDFGLGTFRDLDGEMVMLDGHCYQAVAKGKIHEAEDDWQLPFAVATRFTADRTERIENVIRFDDLTGRIDPLRPSQNVFVGLRIDGVYDFLNMRAICKAKPGEDLVEATSHQSVFTSTDVEGTIVGFWTPTFARTLNVPGYHLHFISADRKLGGHVLDVRAKDLNLALHLETEFHVALPETEKFLQADLTSDPTSKLDVAERPRE